MLMEIGLAIVNVSYSSVMCLIVNLLAFAMPRKINFPYIYHLR